MGDMAEVFRMMKESTDRKKVRSLTDNMNFLNKNKCDYEVYNNGYQLNFNTKLGIISFYPSTNRWVLKGKTYYGNASGFIKWLEREEAKCH